MKLSIAFRILAVLVSLSAAPVALARDFDFEQKSHKQDVFAVNNPARGAYSYTYMPYADWIQKGSGKYFPMDVAPALSGLAGGKVHVPPLRGIDETKYTDQAREFAAVVNQRNRDGRLKVDLLNKTAADNLRDALANTYVVEILISGLIEKPFTQINLSPDEINALPEKIDVDHFHFPIPGTFVQDVLEDGHGEFETLNPQRTYILSVFDFREYNCAAMKDGIRDYFSRSPESERLHNESIYVINQVDLNQPGDIAQSLKYFGRRPDAVIVQQVVYADHVIRAAKSIFAFYAEGQKTRLVLLSNVATKSKYFTGAKGAFLRQYVLDGIVGKGAIQTVTGAYLSAKDKVADLLSGATDDVKKKNACDRGLALGLIRYSESLFGQFIHYVER